jgi:hypothetical protein
MQTDEIDLGWKPEKLSTPESTSEPTPKTVYPSVTISGESADAWIKQNGAPQVGSEYDIENVHAKCTGMRHDQYEKSISFDLMSVGGCEECEMEDSEEPDENMMMAAKTLKKS